MTGMDDLVTWLRAQLDARERELDEDERVASDAAGLSASGRHWARDALSCVVDATDNGLVVYGEGTPTSAQAEHIARWDPDRVLRKVEEGRADIDAKRRILELHAPVIDGTQSSWTWFAGSESESLAVAKLLALPYADRPGWREDWRP